VSRRHDFRRQSTQQRTSRSAGLLFSDDDDDDVKKNKATTKNVFDSLADTTTYRGTGGSAVPLPTTAAAVDGKAADRPWTAVSESQTLSKRRETSPSIAVTKKTTPATGKFNSSVLKGTYTENIPIDHLVDIIVCPVKIVQLL